jgi:hypothetical protein
MIQEQANDVLSLCVQDIKGLKHHYHQGIKIIIINTSIEDLDLLSISIIKIDEDYPHS